METLRKSFKSTGCHRRPADPQEKQPILFGVPHRHDSDNGGGGEVVVKIDGHNDNDVSPPIPNIWRESSYDFYPKEEESGFTFSPPKLAAEISGEDPPSRLIKNFLHKQKASGSETLLDIDLEMDELKTPHSAASKDHLVSFDGQNPNPNPNPKSSSRPSSSSSSDSSSDGGRRPDDIAEVLQCTSNPSLRRSSNPSLRGSTILNRSKTKSRIIDPPPPLPDERKSGRTGILKSGVIGSVNEDDEDPFLDEDLPDDFNKTKFTVLTVLQWLTLAATLAAVVCSASTPVLRRKTVLSLHLWKWSLLALVLVSGRLVSGWAIRLAVLFIERSFLLRKRVLYFVYALRKAVQNCLWLGLVLLSWHYMFDKSVERQTNTKVLPYVTKILFCLLIATVFRLIKTLLVKVLASSFHVSTYFDRIQESLFNQYVVQTLCGPPLIELQETLEEDARVIDEVEKLQKAGARIPSDLRATVPNKRSSGGSGHGPSIWKSAQIGIWKSTQIGNKFSGGMASKQQETVITIDQLHKLNQKNVSAWNMKRLMRIVRHGTLSTLDEQIPPERGGEEESAIRSEYEAKIAAKKIFSNVAQPGAKYIYLVDLMRFMREEEAVKTISLFEGALEKNRISRKSLKNWVVNAFRERRALALTLDDTKTAVNKLHQMANGLVAVIVFALSLFILGIATTHFFVFLSSQLLLAVFMFGNTLKMVFEAIIFLFVMHPFDVGDRCEVDGIQMLVEEMNILTTVFLKADNTKVIYPNTLLSTKPISNFYRSPDQGDAIDFCVHVATPVEKLALMKEKIIGYMESKKEHWYPSPMVVLRDVEDMNKLQVSIWFRHRINFQDMGLKWTRREFVVQELIGVLKDLDIEYRLLPLDVNCRNMPELSSMRLPSMWTTCG